MKDSIFIKALYFAKEHPNGFTKAELATFLGTEEWGPLQREFEGQKPEHVFNQAESIGNQDRYWLTKEGYKLLYELDEVHEAMEQAAKARRLAVISILVAIAVPLLIELLDIWYKISQT
ncbi:MAG: hypothetical protein PHO20_00740 [Candidatus Peribacteraceae bacterium]|nr:hypothetical protein [Candidatus Peribacteraceae bacterium]MDD5739278.1 hypothetical protein [Candidatus Peribacteraceae bacterium]